VTGDQELEVSKGLLAEELTEQAIGTYHLDALRLCPATDTVEITSPVRRDLSAPPNTGTELVFSTNSVLGQ